MTSLSEVMFVAVVVLNTYFWLWVKDPSRRKDLEAERRKAWMEGWREAWKAADEVNTRVEARKKEARGSHPLN